MQRFINLMHLIDVGLGFSTKKGVPKVVAGSPFLVQPLLFLPEYSKEG